MNRRTPVHRTEDVPSGGRRPAWYANSGTLHLAALGFGVVAVGALVYAGAGGTLKITATSVTLAVNARS